MHPAFLSLPSAGPIFCCNVQYYRCVDTMHVPEYLLILAAAFLSLPFTGPTFCCNVQYFVNTTDSVLQRGKACNATSGGHRRMAKAVKLSKLF